MTRVAASPPVPRAGGIPPRPFITCGLLAVALAACVTAPEDGGAFASATHQCMAVNPGFTDAWACIRKLITRGNVGAEDAGRASLEDLGEGLNRQLADESLTSAEARARLSAGLPAARP